MKQFDKFLYVAESSAFDHERFVELVMIVNNVNVEALSEKVSHTTLFRQRDSFLVFFDDRFARFEKNLSRSLFACNFIRAQTKLRTYTLFNVLTRSNEHSQSFVFAKKSASRITR